MSDFKKVKVNLTFDVKIPKESSVRSIFSLVDAMMNEVRLGRFSSDEASTYWEFDQETSKKIQAHVERYKTINWNCVRESQTEHKYRPTRFLNPNTSSCPE
jgi:hypothetical protein